MSDTQTFHVQHAVDLGSPDLAIVIHFFVGVIAVHKRLGRNNIDGRTWNYCSARELQARLPYWSEKQIRTRIKALVEKGILLEGNYNKNVWDQTLWYAFADETRWGISNITYVLPNGKIDDSDQESANLPNGKIYVNTSITPRYTQEQQQEKVVVSSEKKKLIEQYVSPQAVIEFMQYSLEQLQIAIATMEQYKDSQTLKGKTLDSQEAYLRQALKQGWVPRPTEKEKEQQQEVQQEKQKSVIEERCDRAKKWMDKFKGKFTQNFSFSVSELVIFLNLNGNRAVLELQQENCLDILKAKIVENGLLETA